MCTALTALDTIASTFQAQCLQENGRPNEMIEPNFARACPCGVNSSHRVRMVAQDGVGRGVDAPVGGRY